MKNLVRLSLVLTVLCLSVNASAKNKPSKEVWPNGEAMDAWFLDSAKVDVKTLGKRFVLTDYGVRQGTTDIQTKEIQAVIDKASSEGGGVIVVPKGTFYSGSLFFKPKTHLLVEELISMFKEKIPMRIVYNRIELLFPYSILCLDDVDMTLAGKDATQQEIAYIVKRLTEKRKVIILGINLKERCGTLLKTIGQDRYEYVLLDQK